MTTSDTDQPTEPLKEQELKPNSIGYDDLTPSQKEACDGIVDFLCGPLDEPEKILTGYAGTGKTTVIAIAIKRALEESKGLSESDILLAGPTHKACRVVSASFAAAGLRLDVATYASMLGMRGKIDEATGEEIFSPDPSAPECFSKYPIVIADEGSQASHSLKELIDERINLLQRIVWIGDRAQLPPIEKPPKDSTPPHESPVFSLPGWNLEEIVRYDGNLAYLAEALRQDLTSPNLPPIRDFADEETVFCHPRPRWTSELLKAFTSEASLADPDHVRVLAWRNETVAAHNRAIHRARFGPSAPEFCEGETVVANKPCLLEPRILGIPPQVLLTNGSEAKIVARREGVILDVPVLLLDCITEFSQEITLKVVSKGGQRPYNARRQDLKRRALQADRLDRGRAWVSYYQFEEEFHPVSLAYSLTVHKSQGSTFRNVYVDNGDICSLRGTGDRIILRNKLFYVATTRASDAAYFKAA
ncbi:MAG: AAA family ATPase [Cyanobacteria bacterium P01_C01_bin.89]